MPSSAKVTIRPNASRGYWVHLIVLLGIGVIIGAGIFATVGTAAAGDAVRPGAGPALMLSFVITAIACRFAALCYAELASLVPISGSAYTYSYATFGELVAWIIGWDLMLEYSVGTIAVAISWSGYFNGLLNNVFGIHLPLWCITDFRTAIHNSAPVQSAPHFLGIPIIFNAPASMIVVLLTIILVIGIKESSRFNIAIVAIKLLVLAFFIIIGSFYVKKSNWTPFAPNGFEGISAGAAIAFFSFIGFDWHLDGSGGNAEPQKRHAHRHNWLAGDLHGHLHRRYGCLYGHYAVFAAEKFRGRKSRTARLRHAASESQLGGRNNSRRRDRGTDGGTAGASTGAGTDLFLNVTGRPYPRRILPRTPESKRRT